MSIRANRTLEDRARFGLGSDTQDDNTVPATDETPLTAEGVVEAGGIALPVAASAVSADSTTLVGTGTTVQAVFEELDDAVALADSTAVKKTGGGIETVKAVGNTGATETIALVPGTDGNVQTFGVDQNTVITMPSSLGAGAISFTAILTNAGAFTATFTGVKWAAGTAPTLTSGAGKIDIFSFITIDGGTTWYGTVVQDVR